MLTSYVTLKGHPEFMRNQTGFGYMVYDIARAVAKTEEVDLLATDSRGQTFKSDNVLFLKRSWWLFLTHIFQCIPISSLRNLANVYPGMQRGTKLRLLYSWLMTGYVRSIINKRNYDVVHIHGCSFATELWMEICKKCGQKFVVTLHGLNSFSDTVRLEPAGKQYERDFLKRVVDGEFPITVISTGMKRLVQKTYNAGDCKNITVVCNSFTFDEHVEVERVNIRKQYGIPDDAKIVLYVGNIGRRKNQGQLIKAFNYLHDNLADKTYILFLGGNLDADYKLSDFASRTSFTNHFIECGIVEKALVSQYYEQSDAVALMSLSEGFGLSLIEGMHFGLPCMSFSDVDAFEDIYDECAMIGVYEHSDEAVAKGLELLLTKEWDNNAIKEYSKKFESKAMAEKYIDVYKMISI